MVNITNDGWNTSVLGDVDRLSQEHGIIRVTDGETLNRVRIGDIIGIVPIHSCLTADMQACYYTTDGHRIEKMPKT